MRDAGNHHRLPNESEARAFLEGSSFVWHQRFELVAGVYTPGVSPVEHLLEISNVPHDLSGKSVLDIGTSNGGAAFEAERYGAKRVVAVDVYPPDWFGFEAICDFLGSSVEYVQASVYELPDVLHETFDLVIFWGVLYHLRHPLLALDVVRSLTRFQAVIETAVCDSLLPDRAAEPLAMFFKHDELGADPSNWFAPTVRCLLDWCSSSGFEIETMRKWPHDAPSRCLVNLRQTEGTPEFQSISYERPLSATQVIERLMD